MIQKLKQFFSNKKFNISTFKQFCKIYISETQHLKQIYQQKYSKKYNFYMFVKFFLNETLQKKCINCGKQLNQRQINANIQFCSRKCSNIYLCDKKIQNFKKTCLQRYGCKNPLQNQNVKNKLKNTVKNKTKQQWKQILQKRRKTCLQKYGTDSPLKSNCIKQKIKKTCLQRYGTDSPIKNKQISDKKKKTCLQKYGCQYAIENKGIKNKIKQTNLQKYGVQNQFERVDIQQKIKQTNLYRYGYEHASESDIIKQKVKQTNLQKYGVQSVFQSEQIKQKIKQTNLKKYNSEYSLQNQSIREKSKQTNLQKYGYQYSLQNQSIKEKSKQTNLKKYGTQNPFQSELIKQKIKQTNLKKYGSENISNSEYFKAKQRNIHYNKILNNYKNYVIPLFDIEQYEGKNKTYRWKCVKCGCQWQQTIHSNLINGMQTYIPRCLKCYPYLSGFSIFEKQIRDFIQLSCNCQTTKNKQIISPYELDVYLQYKNFAIQCDGLYWHGQLVKENNYQLMKTQLCENKGIQLIHIFQDQWIYKQEIVKDRIKSILGIDRKKIFARKCIIREIDDDIKNIFLNQNHLQGEDNSKVKLGLYYWNELIAVMTFGKPRFNCNYQWQLIRFSSKLGYQVVGGAGKLLTYFQKNYHPKNLISYADRRYSTGKMYYSLGFKFLNNSEPNYWWYKGNIKYSRYQCQKHKLKGILGQNFNPQLSETQNMYLNGFNKIYDCGNMVFGKNF